MLRLPSGPEYGGCQTVQLSADAFAISYIFDETPDLLVRPSKSKVSQQIHFRFLIILDRAA